jgi:hypothetical protein
LERLRSGPESSLERDARRFFALTYPTEDIHEVLQQLSRRVAGETAPGLVLAQSPKGLGKSRVLLLGYHLFSHPAEAGRWATRLGYAWNPAASPAVIVHKFTDQALPAGALWLLLGARLGAEWMEARPPT